MIAFVSYVNINRLHSDQIFSIRRVIAHLSQGTTLEAGSIILTGTPKGVGFVKKPPAYLQHGDRVETWVGANIGTLVNNVVEEGMLLESTKL
jgi:2-keto-4-pentenoate hydratase/2-oxohepta-3-ene-1,7-dioic acid hydratase in catechol pathway